MIGANDLIWQLAARQLGLIARWQALAVGVTDRELRRRVESGALVPVFPGVYRVGGAPFTQETRWLAAVLAAGPEAWLSHRAGCAFRGFDLRFPKAELTIAHERECDLDGVIVHRTRRRHDVITVRGMPVTTKARTLLDVAGLLPYHVFEPLLQNAVTEGLIKIEAMYAILDRRGGRGVRGVTATRRALGGGLVDEKIQKRLELILARIIAQARVPKPERQHRLTCADGREVILDNAWPDRRRAVEAVGLRWHGNAHQSAKTRARARSIRASGWELDEYGWYEATETPDETRRSIEAFWAGSSTGSVLDPAQNENGEESAA